MADEFGSIDDEDFGAIDDEDLGAIPDPAVPEINVYELNRKAEEQNKALQEQAQAQAIQAQQAAAADPKNWTLKQTKDHFKQNPPQTIEEEAVQGSIIKQKTQQIKGLQDFVDGTTLRAAPPKNIFGKMRSKIDSVLGDIGLIESPEGRQAKASITLAIAKQHGLDPVEVEKNFEDYALNPKYTGMMTDITPIDMVNAAMTPAVVAGIVLQPELAIPALAVFGALDMAIPTHELLKKTSLTRDARQALELADMVAKGGVSGLAGKAMATGLYKKFPKFRAISDYYNGLLGNEPLSVKIAAEAAKKAEKAKGVSPEAEVKPVEEVAPSAPELVQKAVPVKIEKDIINPIDPALPQVEKVVALNKLSKENEPLVRALYEQIDQVVGSQSKLSYKTSENILRKANRPEIKEEKPWFDVEHVRDALRFKSKLNTLDDIPKIYGEVKKSGYEIIKSDLNKLVKPKEWGWRFGAFDIRMPNGQIIEYYFLPKEMDAPAIKKSNHLLFEKWRNTTKEERLANHAAYMKDIAQSRKTYDAAWKSYLERVGLTESEALASFNKLATSIESDIGSKLSLRSSGEGASFVQEPLSKTADISSSETQVRPVSGTREPINISDTSKENIPLGPEIVNKPVQKNIVYNESSRQAAAELQSYVSALEGPQTLVSAEGAYSRANDWPPFLSNKGYTKEGILNVLEKFRTGQKLTDNQQFILNDILPKFAEFNDIKIPDQAGKRRKFIDTVRKSEKTAPEVAKKVESLYEPISNKETLRQAQEFVQSDYNNAVELIEGPGRPTAFSNATAIVLIDKAQAEGRFADAIRLVERTAEKQTALGQAIQSLSIYNRLTPEGILMYAQKVVKNARENVKQKGRIDQFEKLRKGLNEQDTGKLADKLGVPHISETVAKELRAMAERIKDMPEGRDKQIETALMLKKIGDLIPRTAGQKASIVQTMAQLLNPKTFIRNLLGNVGFQLQEAIADPVATALDIAVSLKTGKRTVYLPDVKTQAKGLVQGFKEGVEEATKGVNLKDVSSKFTLPKNGVFDKGVMGALEKTLRISLGATDRAFYQAAFNQSIRDQMRAFKAEGKEVLEPTPEMIERAHALGLYRTFQDSNVISNQFVNLKKWLNLNKSFGLGDVILKYPKTPANLLARGIEYSPFGLIKSTYELVKPLIGQGDFNQEAFVRSTSRALTGTATQVGTGAILAGLGIISGKRSDDKDVTATKENVGLRAYQLNVSALKRFFMSGFDPDVAALREDDVLINYDWLLPTSIGLALGANMVIDPKSSLVDRTLNMADKLAQASETLQEQPLVQGVARFAQNRNMAESFTDAAQGIPASFVPTLLNQVRQLTDNTARNTKDLNWFKEAGNKAIMRVPGLSSTLEPRVTTLGEDKQMYQLDSNNPFNVFLNPAFVTKYKPDPVSRMVLEIWENSGETIQFPRVAQGKIKLGSDMPQPLELTAEQYTEYQRYIGNKTDVLFTMLSDNPEFLAQSDEDKAKQLQGFLTDINTAAKIEVLGYEPKRVSEDVLSIIQDIARDKKIIDAADDDDDLGAVDEEP